MINNTTAKVIADLYNGYSDTTTKELHDILYKICQAAIIGKYILILRPDKPILDTTFLSLQELGFNVELDGFTYYVKWKEDEKQN